MGAYVSDFTRLLRVLVVFFSFLLLSNSPSVTLPQFVYPYLLTNIWIVSSLELELLSLLV